MDRLLPSEKMNLDELFKQKKITEEHKIKMYQKILSRSPSNEELLRSVDYIGVVEEKKQERLQRFAQNLLISNEFIFRD